MASKCIFKSRTVLFNALVAAFAVLEAGSGALRGVLSEAGYLGLMMLIAAVNVYLRSITHQPVTLRKPKNERPGNPAKPRRAHDRR